MARKATKKRKYTKRSDYWGDPEARTRRARKAARTRARKRKAAPKRRSH